MEDRSLKSSTGHSDPTGGIMALYSDIGRGHPSYLDSLVYLLKDKHPGLVCRNVFQESKGLSLLSWRFVSWLYSISGKGGLHTRFYDFIRKRSQKGARDSLMTRILGRDLKRAYENFPGICLVDHPILAKSLADVCRVWYVHGEIAAPTECAVRGVEKILVPLEETKNELIARGAQEEAVLVCGLMIEPALVETAEEAFQQRLKRIESDRPLTVGFFTSGAYPKEHMEKIIAGARSVIEKKMRAIIFCGTNRDKLEWMRRRLKDIDVKIVEDTEESPRQDEEFDLMLVTRKTRQEDTQRAVELIPGLDAFVAASHERTNWPVGLGLPMFALFPLIGTFAAQNFEFAQRQRVMHPVKSMGEARNSGGLLAELRQNGQLLQMAKNGFGVHNFQGTYAAVSQFVKRFGLHDSRQPTGDEK
ncbi:MAG: hypothetical protein WBC88_03090 [Candidatus Zixiibacteriota bacterium]